MMQRYKLLDLFCGGGGAGAGYFRAGFDVVGIDIAQQPDYPFRFLRRDALNCDYAFLWQFDAIHASPPCQQYSRGSVVARKNGKVYPDLYRATKAMLEASGLPYVIENVVGSPARGVRLMGHMFGLGVIRERIFESNMPFVADYTRAYYGSVSGGEYVTVAGNSKGASSWGDAMGINWISSRETLKEAIPPAYTEFLGLQLVAHLDEKLHNHKHQENDKNREHDKRLQYELRNSHKSAASHLPGASNVPAAPHTSIDAHLMPGLKEPAFYERQPINERI